MDSKTRIQISFLYTFYLKGLFDERGQNVTGKTDMIPEKPVRAGDHRTSKA
jgi:hypothetical protein